MIPGEPIRLFLKKTKDWCLTELAQLADLDRNKFLLYIFLKSITWYLEEETEHYSSSQETSLCEGRSNFPGFNRYRWCCSDGSCPCCQEVQGHVITLCMIAAFLKFLVKKQLRWQYRQKVLPRACSTSLVRNSLQRRSREITTICLNLPGCDG